MPNTLQSSLIPLAFFFRSCSQDLTVHKPCYFFLVCFLVTPIYFGDLPRYFAGSGRIGAKATSRIHMIGKWIIPSSLRGPWFEWGSSFTGRLFKSEATHFGTSYISLGAVGFRRAHISTSQGRPDGAPYDGDEPRCTLMLLLLMLDNLALRRCSGCLLVTKSVGNGARTGFDTWTSTLCYYR